MGERERERVELRERTGERESEGGRKREKEGEGEVGEISVNTSVFVCGSHVPEDLVALIEGERRGSGASSHLTLDQELLLQDSQLTDIVLF